VEFVPKDLGAKGFSSATEPATCKLSASNGNNRSHLERITYPSHSNKAQRTPRFALRVADNTPCLPRSCFPEACPFVASSRSFAMTVPIILMPPPFSILLFFLLGLVIVLQQERVSTSCGIRAYDRGNSIPTFTRLTLSTGLGLHVVLPALRPAKQVPTVWLWLHFCRASHQGNLLLFRLSHSSILLISHSIIMATSSNALSRGTTRAVGSSETIGLVISLGSAISTISRSISTTTFKDPSSTASSEVPTSFSFISQSRTPCFDSPPYPQIY